MGAAGITIIAVALLFGWEALVHFRRVGAASATSTGGSSPSGSSPATTSSASPGAPSSSVPSSQPGTSGTSQPVSGHYITQQDAQNFIAMAHRLGIDPNALMAIAAHESGLDPTNDKGDGGLSWGLFQLYSKVWPVSKGCALSASCNMQFWESNFGAAATRQYNATCINGVCGQAAFAQYPYAFLQAWVPGVQGSDPWSQQNAIDALNLVAQARQRFGV